MSTKHKLIDQLRALRKELEQQSPQYDVSSQQYVLRVNLGDENLANVFSQPGLFGNKDTVSGVVSDGQDVVIYLASHISETPRALLQRLAKAIDVISSWQHDSSSNGLISKSADNAFLAGALSHVIDRFRTISGFTTDNYVEVRANPDHRLTLSSGDGFSAAYLAEESIGGPPAKRF